MNEAMRFNQMKQINITTQFFIIMLLILTVTMIITFLVSYEIAKRQVLNAGGEMIKNTVKDSVGFMDAMNQRVDAGDVTLEAAQEIVRTYILGPKQQDGSRSIEDSKMAVNDSMYTWAIHPDGTIAMHPFDFENRNYWDMTVNGKYTVRDSWANIRKSGQIFRELWQNPGEPVYTFIAYQEYYAPWDWIVGTGESVQILYAKSLESMKYTFLYVTALIFLLAFMLIFLFSRRMIRKINRINDAMNEIGKGDLRQYITFNFHDEFGRLADSFNSMVHNMQEWMKHANYNPLLFAENSQEAPARKSFLNIKRKELLYHIYDESELYLRRLSESESRLIQMVTIKVLKAQEEERKRLARDLHDGIGQALYSVSIAMKLLNANIRLNRQTQAYFNDAESSLSKAMSEIKTMMNELRPSALEKLGLLPAIQSYLSTFEAKSGIQVTLQAGSGCRRYPSEIEIAVYRAIQEALLNAAKYARCDSILVVLNEHQDELELIVQDPGAGFDVSKNGIKNNGFGLYGMQERVILLEGSFHIESSPGKGTKIHISIPVPKE